MAKCMAMAAQSPFRRPAKVAKVAKGLYGLSKSIHTYIMHTHIKKGKHAHTSTQLRAALR